MNRFVRSGSVVGVCILPLLLLAGCEIVRTDFPHTPNEIADHPEILYNNTVPRGQMTLKGVRIDDPGFSIREERVIRRGDAGWVVCRDGSRYRLENKTVVTLGVWDERTLDQLHIESPADIEKKFGKPQNIDDTQELLIYRYANGSLSVLWNKQEAQVNAVNVSK